MDLISRAQWGARAYREPSGSIRYAGSRKGVKVHYLGGPYTSRPHTQCAAYVRQLQAQHMDGNGWSDIGYSFLVCEHGSVYEGRGLVRRNSANGNTALNEAHYAVCALHGTTGRPSDALLSGLRDAIDYCRSRGPAGGEIKGHRDGYATACPGDALYAWVQDGAPRPSTTAPETGGTDVPEHLYFERKSPVTLTPGTWYTITWDRIWRPGVGWKDRDLAQTLLSGANLFSLDFALRAKGLAPGQEIQMRVGRNSRKDGGWGRAKSWPINSPVHDGGDGHFTHHWGGFLPAYDDNRLVCDVLVGGDKPITVDQLTASLLYWPA